MKIALFHNLYGELSRGGAETVVRQQAEQLRSAGHEVWLITTKPRRSTLAAVETDADGLKIYRLSSCFAGLGKHGLGYRLAWQVGNMFSLGRYYRIKKILQTEKPDRAITHNLMGLGFLTPLLLRRLGIRHEHFLHDIQLLHPSGLMIWGQERIISGPVARLYQTLTRRLFAAPALVVSPSRWLLELHQKNGFFINSAAEICPLKLTAAAGARSATGKAAGHFLFVGQLEEHKGIFLLIEAFKKLADPAARLFIVGDGRQTDNVREAAAGDERVSLAGRLDSAAVQKAMLASHYLVLPSLCYENSPTVIYEAHAAGLPVIAAALGGITEITGPQDILFRPGDLDDLKQKLESCLK
ncbi:MAG: glycosyltransferase [Patescibacteria group bacterium]